MGTYLCVMMASGRLMSNPKRRPTSQPGQPGNWIQPMTNPMAKRLVNAASKAVLLSGKDMGSMSPTSSAPKSIPAIRPRTILDMWNRVTEIACTHNMNRNQQFVRVLHGAIGEPD
jgi:hypothetical protein